MRDNVDPSILKALYDTDLTVFFGLETRSEKL